MGTYSREVLVCYFCLGAVAYQLEGTYQSMGAYLRGYSMHHSKEE